MDLIWNMGLWEATVSTIALVLISTMVAIIIGVPLGILTAMSKVATASSSPSWT